MEKLFWSTQVPVFNYITKYYNNYYKSSDKPGFLKRMYDSFQKNMDHIKNMDPELKKIVGYNLCTAAIALSGAYLLGGSTTFMRSIGYIASGATFQRVPGMIEFFKKVRNL